MIRRVGLLCRTPVCRIAFNEEMLLLAAIKPISIPKHLMAIVGVLVVWYRGLMRRVEKYSKYTHTTMVNVNKVGVPPGGNHDTLYPIIGGGVN